MGYRPALDGLRGMAILLVVASHTGVPEIGAAGPIGVTVFFTLSGFLITGLLLAEHERAGRIDLRDFYIRRLRRLGPALLAMVVSVAAAGVVLGGWWFQWRDVLPVLLYVGNWVEADTNADLGALGITWSLAIEEQFYLLWPLALIVLASRRRWLLVVAGVLTIASLWTRAHLIAEGADPQRVYFGSDTAAVALLAGVLAVTWRTRRGPGRSSLLGSLASVVVILALCTWPQVVANLVGMPIAAAATAALLCTVTGPAGMRWLEVAWLRWFGLRAYSLYLLHGPLMWAMRDHYDLGWLSVTLVGVPISLLAAEASYRWVELPFRRGRSSGHSGEVDEKSSGDRRLRVRPERGRPVGGRLPQRSST